jgi:hypothetical protein
MDTWKVFGVFFGIIGVLFAVLLLFPPTNNTPERPGYLEINNETMICEYYYLCFLRNGTWHKPSYNAGVNLILANNLEVENESQIKQFFEQEKINIVTNTTEEGSPENSELILKVTPFSHYIGYYYTIKKQDKTIKANFLSQYNSTEPAIIILGPNLGAKEDSIKFDGKNIIVQGQSSEGLSLVLGKLLLIIVS